MKMQSNWNSCVAEGECRMVDSLGKSLTFLIKLNIQPHSQAFTPAQSKRAFTHKPLQCTLVSLWGSEPILLLSLEAPLVT